MDAFINVIRKNPEVRVKIKIMLDRYMSLPYDYCSRTGYDALIQNVILKEKKGCKEKGCTLYNGYNNNRL